MSELLAFASKITFLHRLFILLLFNLFYKSYLEIRFIQKLFRFYQVQSYLLIIVNDGSCFAATELSKGKLIM